MNLKYYPLLHFFFLLPFLFFSYHLNFVYINSKIKEKHITLYFYGVHIKSSNVFHSIPFKGT